MLVSTRCPREDIFCLCQSEEKQLEGPDSVWIADCLLISADVLIVKRAAWY